MVITGHFRHVFRHREEQGAVPLWMVEEINYKKTCWADVFGCHCNVKVRIICQYVWDEKDSFTTSSKTTHQLFLLGELTL